MANEIKFGYLSGKTLYFNIFDITTDKAYRFSDNTWQTWATGASPTNFEVALTEIATNSGVYMGDLNDVVTHATNTFTTTASAGEYLIVIRNDADDTIIGQQSLYWDGTQEVGAAAWELAQTKLTFKDEAAVATDMLGALAQLWRRFFNKVTKDGSTITTHQNDNSTALPTHLDFG